MANQTSARKDYKYEVFLSFRGPDTRQGLSDCLYNFMNDAGIRVFRDDDELSIAQPIETILLEIENSQICMPVFSPTFASSAWCLHEVAKMVELRKEIVPIFAGVMPDDVKLRSPVYGDDMDTHAMKYGEYQVKQWADALKQITKIKGRELKDKGYWEFCKVITGELLIKLNTSKKYVPNYLLGVDDQVEALLKLLKIGFGGVRYIGIHGMGGVGNTTLAKVLFNKLSPTFESCCFLPDIRESSRCKGIESLQKELICKLDGKLRYITTNIDPTEMLKAKLSREKVLIVLDDVDQKEQITKLVGESNCFALGSRIIVTTRDVQVLRIGIQSFDGTFEAKEMTFSQGIQLFSHHAFRMESPPQEFESLSEEVVRLCKGLPLALEVLGSFLCQKDKRQWSETMKNLEKGPDRTVLDKLKISYEALEHGQQQNFLDIAYFFINTEQSYASYMWDACGFSPSIAIDALVSMSLIKIIDDDKLWMHDHLRDLGREIVRGEGQQISRSCSRLWENSEDIMHILKNKEGKEGLVGLRLEGTCPYPMDEVLARSQGLRFLHLENAKFKKKFKHPLPQLKWLSMCQCPSSFSVAHLNIRNLIILKLPDSSINENWKGWSCIKMVNLKVLDLTNCIKLTCTPNFSRIPNLERLTLRRCTNLVKLHPSIIQLKTLRYMNLNQCSSLRELPEEIGDMANLEQMHLRGCNSLNTIPNSLEKLKSLVALDISRDENPFDLWRSIFNYSLGSKMHDDMDFLLLMGYFDQSMMGQTKFTAKILKDISSDPWLFDKDYLPVIIGILPRIFSQYKALQLPQIFCDLKILTKLDLSYLSVSSLPESIGYLENLVELRVKRSFMVTLPKSIGTLKKLETLDLTGSGRLAEIPEEIGGLSNLRTLNLSWTGVKQLPSRITQLSLLQSLSLARCPRLGQQYQHSRASWIGQPAESSEHVQLLNALPASFGDFSRLETLELYCLQLKHIPALPSSLRSATFEDINTEVKLPFTCNNVNLTYLLIVYYCGETKVGNMESLPESLRELRIYKADALPEMSNLKNLRKLIVGGGNLKEIKGLARLESLEELDISNCRSLESLVNLAVLKNLKYLSTTLCPKLTIVEGQDRLALVQNNVHLGDCECTQCLIAARKPSRRKELVLWMLSNLGFFRSDEINWIRQYLKSKILLNKDDQ